MPARRKTSTAAVEEPKAMTEETTPIEEVSAQEVDKQVKPLLESAEVVEPKDAPAAIDEEQLRILMAKMLQARERAQQARERVRELNSEVPQSQTISGMGGKIKERYQKATEELAAARRTLNLTRAELFTALRSWNKSYRMAY